MTDSTVLYAVDTQGVAHISLNRADKRNAFDAEIIQALTERLDEAGKDPGVRIIVLSAQGKHFSAGADLNWMRDSAQWSEQDNVHDAHKLARLMNTLDRLPKPTIARVQGAAFGGALGLICCCDIAVAADNARFCLSEARLGLAPAVISPYVIRAIGARQARRYFLTTEEISVDRALGFNLVHEVVSEDELDQHIESLCHRLLRSGPEALLACKHLIERVEGRAEDADLEAYTAQLIARLRTGDEGQEGLTAFFEKRLPDWAPKEEH